jgi:hypothetical protein
LNPAVYIPGTCQAGQFGLTAAGPCSQTSNTSSRRVLFLENPNTGRFFGTVNRIDSGATGSYHGLVLSLQRRAVRGVTITSNYTFSHCINDNVLGNTGNSGNADAGYLNPQNRNFDRGNCDADRRHLFSLSSVAQTPQFPNSTLRILASGWRFSPILKVLSGGFMTMTTSSDVALTAIASQRVNQLQTNVYGDKTIGNYLNPRAFALPATGTLGSAGRNSVLGPGSWQFDLALSRSFQVREAQRVEFRAEAFNVTNSFIKNNPTTNLNSGNFGQITSAKDPRIMQFALKYFF